MENLPVVTNPSF